MVILLAELLPHELSAARVDSRHSSRAIDSFDLK
jgi:hypothetical protein